jgi:carboxypeptidase PM20D1
VVPVEPGTEDDWTHPPFSGAITNDASGAGHSGYQGSGDRPAPRGGNLIAQGFTPEHDIWFAFGHDEEVRRRDGADHIAALLEKRGVRPALVLDEGGCVTAGALKGTERPVAFIGIAEKGFVNLRLEARGTGGHSSMPPQNTAAALLARAVHRVGGIRRPLRLTIATRAMFRALAPAMPFGQRMLLANLWFFAPLFVRIFGKSTSGRACFRPPVRRPCCMGARRPMYCPSTPAPSSMPGCCMVIRQHSCCALYIKNLPAPAYSPP